MCTPLILMGKGLYVGYTIQHRWRAVRRIVKTMMKVSDKIWRGRTPGEVLSKRYKIFVLLGILFIALSIPLYLAGVTFTNFELIIPTLVVIGSFSLHCGSTKFWRGVTRYFGVIALASVFIIYLVVWGPRPIQVFTLSGFIIVWMLAMRNKLSMFDKFKKLLWRTTLTAAIAIILFDVWTGLVGHPLTTGVSLWVAFLGQIPFTLYHLASLVFVPPLVGLGKMLVKVKVPVPVAVAAGAGVRTRIKK